MPGLISFDTSLAAMSRCGEVVATKASNETPTVTGLSGELLTNVVCEDGVCRIDTTSTSAVNTMLDTTKENVKID